MIPNKKEKKGLHWSVRLVVLLIWLFSAALLGVSLWIIKEVIVNYIVDKKEIANEINTFFPYVAGLIDLCITTLVAAWIQAKIDIRINAPQILIVADQVRQYNISGMKKNKTSHYSPKVFLGESQARYRVVYATLKNVGKGIMSECIINKQNIYVSLDPGACSKLYLLLYIPSEGDESNVKSTFRLPYAIRDINNNSYVGEYIMQIDLSNCQAMFHSHKKIKRERN